MLKIETSVSLQYNLNELCGLVVKDVKDQYGVEIKQTQVHCLYENIDDDYDDDDTPVFRCIQVQFNDEQKKAIIKHHEKPTAPPQANLVEVNSKWHQKSEGSQVYRFVGTVYDHLENVQTVLLRSVNEFYDTVVISQEIFNKHWKKAND